MHGAPNEVPDAIPFQEQVVPGAYDPAAAHDFWRALASIAPVFEKFRSGYLGKSSPVEVIDDVSLNGLTTCGEVVWNVARGEIVSKESKQLP